ncbi:hypothetical protein B0H16DRAFT_1310249 [Mycena metata]|uniref:DDE Tnp4 domain-containing protein n=1 Tax=Mycena metata TaxID=1033252 RepID=A0AAD7JKN5_9AGAR|nr:hypothetical protein B0H16DRAFT_1310249 [Mycena metata]
MRWVAKKLLLTLLLPSLNDGDPIFSTFREPPGPTALYAGLASHLEEQATSQRLEPERGRPEQGGQRITPQWLYTLRPREILYRFRFYADELLDLAAALRIPEPFITEHRYSFPAIEALCLLLARYKSCEDQYDLCMKYDRSQSSISEVVNELTIWLDERWKGLLTFDTDGILSPDNLAKYAAAIYAAGAPLQYIWGFINCTIRRICHPIYFQKQAFNGYKRIHALKYQAVRLPNVV